MSCFNFVWLDVTTFRPYVTEISYQKTIDIENLGSDSSLELLDKVFNWQDRRTKEVFELIVKDFMNNKNKKNFKGRIRYSKLFFTMGNDVINFTKYFLFLQEH